VGPKQPVHRWGATDKSRNKRQIKYKAMCALNAFIHAIHSSPYFYVKIQSSCSSVHKQKSLEDWLKTCSSSHFLLHAVIQVERVKVLARNSENWVMKSWDHQGNKGRHQPYINIIRLNELYIVKLWRVSTRQEGNTAAEGGTWGGKFKRDVYPGYRAASWKFMLG